MAIAFYVTLHSNDWDSNLNAWRCPALRIPGSEVNALFDKGSRVDFDWYEVLDDHDLIKWVRDATPPAEVTAFITLSELLSTKATTDRWKQLAVILPFFATMFTAGVTFTIARMSMTKGNTAQVVQPQQSTLDSSNPKLTNPNAPIAPATAVGTRPPNSRGSFTSTVKQPINPLNKALEQFRNRNVNQPKIWDSYNSDLTALSDLLQSFLGYLQTHRDKVDRLETDKFLREVLAATVTVRGRAEEKLPNEDPFRDLHVLTNTEHFESIVNKITSELGRSSNYNLSPERIEFWQNDVSNWLNGALVHN